MTEGCTFDERRTDEVGVRLVPQGQVHSLGPTSRSAPVGRPGSTISLGSPGLDSGPFSGTVGVSKGRRLHRYFLRTLL